MPSIEIAKAEAAIDAKIEKLRRVKELLRDEEAVAVLREVLSSSNGGHPNGLPPPPMRTEQSLQPPPQTPAVPHSGEPVRTLLPPPGTRGSLLFSALHSARAFAGAFTANQLQEAMEADGYQFRAQDKQIAVNGAIARLIETGQIQLESRGSGSRPNWYRRREQ